ncbi:MULTISPECIES: nucleoside triphosphate pyrophosphohydrolase [Pseudomonadati]|uniref:Nucleoside triphosphate pyrophosphohydrolase n=1 Tax=Shewanella aestuarii TaxID=1028752 RepID=A0ABT0L0Z0_9GAMM|nr:nucleoside triphosphate pyrophosphohydrolase [Shewanella aestuarii]MCL1117289.1 nucleoside triphosphate pyrophosphohydrolase [Shewanella aestuarii]GGN74507.1 nucleoside triphosphate pyrophosphohydrolase [Shewanella aestuarii]
MDIKHQAQIQPLLEIMQKLRHPVDGCPWDLAQDFQTIVPFTIEEAYEVADAIERTAWDELPDELGDLLFQVVFYCQLATEQGKFDFSTVVERICAKLIRRHPHVFNAPDIASPEHTANQVKQTWEAIKAQERADKLQLSLLDDIPQALPALKRAIKIQTRVAKVGFDWPELEPVVAKIYEEVDEVLVEAKLVATDPEHYQPKVVDEMGDLLFAVVNLARHLNVDPEQALRQANNKFERRFKGVENCVVQSGKQFDDHSLEQLDSYWDQVKRQEKTSL